VEPPRIPTSVNDHVLLSVDQCNICDHIAICTSIIFVADDNLYLIVIFVPLYYNLLLVSC
jgi:hypothetical protein